jgi:hypothetical protein
MNHTRYVVLDNNGLVLAEDEFVTVALATAAYAAATNAVSWEPYNPRTHEVQERRLTRRAFIPCCIRGCSGPATHEVGGMVTWLTGRVSLVCIDCLKKYNADDGLHGWLIGTPRPERAHEMGPWGSSNGQPVLLCISCLTPPGADPLPAASPPPSDLQLELERLMKRVKVLETAIAPLDKAAWNPNQRGHTELYGVSGDQRGEIVNALRAKDGSIDGK